MEHIESWIISNWPSLYFIGAVIEFFTMTLILWNNTKYDTIELFFYSILSAVFWPIFLIMSVCFLFLLGIIPVFEWIDDK